VHGIVVSFLILNDDRIFFVIQPQTIKINQPDQGASGVAAQKSACCGS